jgi:hypothetical protein
MLLSRAVMLLNSTEGVVWALKLLIFSMKETPRRKVTDTSSLTKISTDQLGNRMVVTGAFGQIFKDDGTVFSPHRMLHDPSTLQLPSADTHTHTHTGPYADNFGHLQDD